MQRGLIALFLAFVVSLGASAHAEEPTNEEQVAKAKAASAEGQKLYENGVRLTDRAAKLALYNAAHQKFRLAYALDPKPDYLFNIAQTARFQDDCPTALGAYKRVAELVKKDDEKRAEMMRIVSSWIDRLSATCEPTDEFNNPEPADDMLASGGTDNGSDTSSGLENTDPPRDMTTPEKTEGRAPPSRSAWVGATIGLSAVAVALGGYAGYEALRLRSGGHYDEEFAIAADLDGFFPTQSGNPCEDPFLGPETEAACADGEAAARRANLALVGAASFGVAAIVTGYFAFRSQPGASGDETVITQGPGDVGLSVRATF